MTRPAAPRSHLRRSVPVAVALLAAGCVDARDATTSPATPQAQRIDELFWVSTVLGVLVWLAVVTLLAVPIVRSWRRRRRGEDDPGTTAARPAAEGDPDVADRGTAEDVPAAEVDGPIAVADPSLREEAARDRQVRTRLIRYGGIAVPVVILLGLLTYSAVVGRAVAHVPEEGDLEVEVVGHMFWWEVRYPDLGIVTANEIVVPVDQRVRLRLVTEDVIHSFWMPRLHGKVDMIPGQENLLTFTATETGTHRGHCAEFCGIAHAQMIALVHVVEADAFDDWAAGQREGAGEPASTEGEQVFLEAGCAACHAVRGTAAVGGVGPDLTHLASRETLAAGVVPNTREWLAELIVDPQSVKPGIAMPPAQLPEDELEALLEYLEGLE